MFAFIFLESIVHPAIGSVLLEDAIPNTTVSVTPAFEKTNTKTTDAQDPCTDLSGLDTDGDGINDICDLDDDNDGILDADECESASGLVTNGDFSSWIYSSGWTGAVWNRNSERAWYAQWSGTGSLTFYQTISVSAGSENTITFDVGANADYSGEVVLNVQIDGVSQFSETSTSIAAANGGNAIEGNTTLNMATRSITFTPTTNSVTLTFEGISPTSNHDVLYIDNVSIETGCLDFDGDLVPNYLDLDSDNDGIYDAVEAGHNVSHTNGKLTGTIGLDGIIDALQASGQENSGTVTYSLLDSDYDSNNDFIALDSDGDGCLDVVEASFTASTTNPGELQGTGYNPTTGLVTGNTNGYTIPADANTDFLLDYRVSGFSATITNQVQDIGVAEGNNATFSVSVSGTGITYQWQVSTDEGVSYNDISGANSSSYTVNSVTLADNQNRYRVQISDPSYTCGLLTSNSALLIIALDADNDGVIDTEDLDDDNDGILDEVEANNCGLGDATVDVNIFSEDFGNANGNRIATPYTNYAYEDGTGSAGGSPYLQDGQYTIFEDIYATANWAPLVWQSVGDHTTGSDRMMIVNSDNTAGLEFYRRSLVQVTANVALDISFWVMNIDTDIPDNIGRIEPDITVNILQSGVIVHTFNTGSIPREANGDTANAWKEFGGSFTPISNTELELVLINNAPGGLGNDLAIDDIKVIQAFCDSDGDGTPNTLQVDSDGDGCNDADEAYANSNADIDNNGMYGSGSPAVNADGTVVAASYIPPADANLNLVQDYKEVGIAPAITINPIGLDICPGCSNTMTVTATNADTFQWQLFNGTSWENLSNSGIYNGVTTNTLFLNNVTSNENGNQYRVLVSNSTFVCTSIISNTVNLTLKVTTVITNRQITDRVKKN